MQTTLETTETTETTEATETNETNVIPLTSLHRTPTVRLPRRFDVHRVDDVEGELPDQASHDGQIVLDGSQVEMIDMSALRALDRWAADSRLRIVEPSVALAMTIRYTRFERLAELCPTSATAPATLPTPATTLPTPATLSQRAA